jgi:ribonuclease P protein component
MAFELAWQPRLGAQFSPEEEERVGKFYLLNLSLKHFKKIYSSSFVAASLTNKLGVFISTPKSIFPKAVERNKIKRRIKSIVFDEGFEPASFGIKIVVRKDFLALNYKEAYNEISAVLKNAVL